MKNPDLQQPYRPYRLRATFETWVLNRFKKQDDILQNANKLATEVPGQFVVEIRLGDEGRKSVYKPVLAGTLQGFNRTFSMSALPECKSFVSSHFKKQLTEWEEVK